MSNLDHEPVMAALLTHMKDTLTGYLTIGRRANYWTNVTAQPALFLRHIADEDEYDGSGLGKTAMIVEALIYCRAGEDPATAPDIALNELTKDIRQALAPDDASGNFTLGGMVEYCRIEGRSEFSPGDLDKQSLAGISIRILLP